MFEDNEFLLSLRRAGELAICVKELVQKIIDLDEIVSSSQDFWLENKLMSTLRAAETLRNLN